MRNRTYSSNTEDTLVAFHTSGGGGNNKRTEFIDQDIAISEFVEDLNLTAIFENEKKFQKRFGYDTTNCDQRCILDLISDRNFDELEEKFGITEKMLGEEIFVGGGGNSTGLTRDEYESGIGCIDIDGPYNTTCVCLLKDCSDEEFELILESGNYVSDDVLAYCKKELGIEDEDEDEETA